MHKRNRRILSSGMEKMENRLSSVLQYRKHPFLFEVIWAGHKTR